MSSSMQEAALHTAQALEQRSGTVGDQELQDTPLAKAVRNTPPCYLQPYHFFVSWQGVLTLAYGGFPPALETLKGCLQQLHPGLPNENPGARWPKTSLGCLKEKTRLDQEQLQRLIDVCKRCTRALAAEPGLQQGVLIDSASVVLFECRSLERCVARQHIPMHGSAPPDQPGDRGVDKADTVDGRQPSAEQADYVRKVVAEWDAPDYWFDASKDGNREMHYRGNAMGATLVHWVQPPGLGGAAVQALLSAVQAFRREVDATLPGMYAWFDDASLHVTLRNLKD